MDSDPRQRPYEFTRDRLLCLCKTLTELPVDAAAAEEWVKPFSDTLARCVPIAFSASFDLC